MIVEDGYNRGRDYIVSQITQITHWKGMWWKGEVEWREGLLQRGNRGMHFAFAWASELHMLMYLPQV